MLRGTWMVSDWTEVTVVPSVLAGSVQRARLCQSKSALAGRDLSPSLPMVVMWRGCVLCERRAAKAGDWVAADPGLSS